MNPENPDPSNLFLFWEISVIPEYVKMENCKQDGYESDGDCRRKPSFQKHFQILTVNKFNQSAQQDNGDHAQDDNPFSAGSSDKRTGKKAGKHGGRNTDQHFEYRSCKVESKGVSSGFRRVKTVQHD